MIVMIHLVVRQSVAKKLTKLGHCSLLGFLLLMTVMLTAGRMNRGYNDNRKFYDRRNYWTEYDWNVEKGLFPSVNNLASNAIISANATCGEVEPEIYCKLVEHVFMREPQCGLCDARSESSEHRHPIINAIDGTNKWWQSPTLQNGKKYEWVTITLDLKQVFQIAYVIVKAGVSPRPGNWVLEHSKDGLIYKPWQYYAISDAECWEAYGIRPTLGKPRFRSDDEVICTSYYSKLNPLEGGEIHTSLVNGRPGAESPSDTLRKFTTARFIRLRLQKIRTLNADLMTMQSHDPQKIDKSTTRRYFYSIKDISIGGQCVCYGHAKNCPLNPETSLFQCKCEHNTCGENCEQCCPLYQQKLWRPGSIHDGAACEKCQCYGHSDICFYDQTVADKKASLNINEEYEGGGVCIKCQHHTTGINCEQCEDGYYRPAGIKRDDMEPCRRCRCAGPGVTGFCVKDDSYILEGIHPGDCICKEGFAGSKCDHCAIGYKHYPVCERCPCNPAGTEGEATCEGQCVCKKNAEGARCEFCKTGHYNLDAENSDGCTPCYCSGVTNRCEPSDWGAKVIHTLNDWLLSDLLGLYSAIPQNENGFLKISSEAMKNVDNYYWLAPPEYLGKKLYSYGGELRYVIGYTVIENGGIQNDAPGVILESDSIRIGYYFGSRKIHGNITVSLPLQERAWSHLTAAGKRSRAVTKETFAAVLNNVSRLLIRAKYHSDQVFGVLYNVEMEIADKWSSSLKKMLTVEKCECPLGYTGLSCEICESGYRRVNETLHKGLCVPCKCHSHARSCDPYTGYCIECDYNTTGRHCEICKEGFHGNPLRGTPEDCQPCACPLLNRDNNFSPICKDIVTSDGATDYICTACAIGYTGNKCERCASGYFGTPGIPGKFCQQCDCTGNADTFNTNWCDHITGECLKCIGNTGGWHCNECLEGHYGSAYRHDCKPCECSPVGAVSSVCDPDNGICDCRMNFIGKNCDRCKPEYGNVELGCVPCQCNGTGTIEVKVNKCDPVSGKCECKPGVFGLKCDSCLEGYYGFSETGCKWCGCDSNGAINIQCNENGKCPCKANVWGDTCNKCISGYWKLLEGHGCEPCKCNAVGSVNSTCDEVHGRCDCRSGVGGDKCDECLPGYFGFSSEGCEKCEPCKSSGHICHNETGECVCPPNTEGEKCQRCTSSSWGYDPLRGCKPCNCNWRGSASDSICDVDNGNCICLEGFEGRRCDKCRFAHFQFPICRKCECHFDGTHPDNCTMEGLCQCDENGECPCKHNVEGLKCDSCKPGTFGLALDNPKGCLDCFCFQRSNSCKQAEMVWSEITASEREVQFELGGTPLATKFNFLLIPGTTGNVKLGIPYILSQPVYWMLPREFLGEKTRSYNSIFSFHIESRSSRHYPDPLLFKYPLAILHGNGIALSHSPILPVSGGKYSVQLQEDEWMQLENPEVPVTRSLLMFTLQNVQDIMVRATEGADVKIARISDVTLEMAVPLTPTPASPYVAVGIEQCNCPKEYGGLSCQDPGKGYYRKVKNFNESKELIDLIGESTKCPCNNRSEICDPQNGHCQNCRENTAGAFCELCAKGFYGDPLRDACKPCACPLVNNSFSETCHAEIKLGSFTYDHICTNCQEGYEGKKCERCSRGFYGNPEVPGDSCKPCNCNPYGSLDRVCDRMTGQCYCRRDITGRDCTQCSPRHILTDSGCKSCDDECIGPLLNDIEYLVESAAKLNISNFSPPPWIPLLKLDNQTIMLKEAVTKYYSVLDAGQNISHVFSIQFDFVTLVDLMYLRGRDMNIRAPHLAFDSLYAKEDAEVIFKSLDKIWKIIYESINHLQVQGANLNFSEAAVTEKISWSENALYSIKNKDIDIIREEVEREMRKANQISDAVHNSIMNFSLFTFDEKSLKSLTNLLSEFIHLIERRIRLPSVKSTVIVCDNREIEEDIHKNILLAEQYHDMANDSLVASSVLLEEAKILLSNVSTIFEDVLPLQKVLENATEHLEHHRGILARINPRYIQKFVVPAAEWAERISKQALYLQNLFSGTKIASQFPLLAAQVFKDIISNIEAADQSAVDAYREAQRVLNEAEPGRPGSMSSRAKSLRITSKEILYGSRGAEYSRTDVLDTKMALKRKKNIIHQISEDIKHIKSSLSNFKKDIDLLVRGLGDRLHDIDDQRKQTSNQLEQVHRNVDTLLEMLNRVLFPKLHSLQVRSSAGLSNTSKTINIAKITSRNAGKRATLIEKRVERIKGLNAQMQLNVRDLKNKILLARQKASSIRVSLSSDSAGICVRSYQPDIEPTSTNTIVLHYAVKDDAVNNSLLLFLASSVTEDYMIIEMVNRKIRFLWNAGGGSEMIQHNLTIKTNDEQLLRDECWYKIEVQRFGYIATLSVMPTIYSQNTDAHMVTGKSPEGYSKMDLDSTSFFYIGGTPKGYRVPRDLIARNFAGCLYQVILDGKKVGLWNFVSNQGCSGCKEGAAEEVDFSAYSFRGDGYAILPQIKRYKKRSYVVTMRFKTFDENALLFFAPNVQSGDFVSLELRDGYVVYQFNLGSQSRSVLKTSQKYNTGNWTRLVAQRENLQGSLGVDEESQEGQLPANSPTTMDLQKTFIYYGGVPPNFTTTLWSGITFKRYFGCMKDLQIDSTPLDLLQNASYGVEASCKDIPQNTVGFKGAGYIEMIGQPLRQESSFSFSFQTTQDTAVLLLSTFDSGRNFETKRQDYYSIAIVDGEIEARFNGGSGETRIISKDTYDDGNYHTITVLKIHRKLTLRIDDIEVGSDRLPKGSKEIDAPPHRGLFFGGFKEGIDFNLMISTNVPFFGIIKDAIFYNRLLQFNEPVSFKGVGIGRYQKDWFGVEAPYAGIIQPLETCAEMASYNTEMYAYKFGDEPYSHAKMPISRKEFVDDFNVEFDLRTYYPNGLLALVKNDRSVSHFAVMLHDGKVAINMFDRKHRNATYKSFLNDGNWHHISITKKGRNMTFNVDSKDKVIVFKVRRRLALRSPLFIGGVPENMEPNPKMKRMKVILESFKGCIRNFILNEQFLDIITGNTYHVGHCFSKIEPGAYFPGDAYAIYDKKFNLGMKLDIQMEFKTTRQNGILLALSEEYDIPSVALELYNGTVVITVILGNVEKPFFASRSFESPYHVCDGQWHMVTAQYAHREVTLKVDLFDVSIGLSESSPLEPHTATPLFIGGIPDDTPTGAVHSRSNFVGCLKNIAINDRRADVVDMAARHNVGSNACPTF